jgi:uncharacterized membrane protein YwzB
MKIKKDLYLIKTCSSSLMLLFLSLSCALKLYESNFVLNAIDAKQKH